METQYDHILKAWNEAVDAHTYHANFGRDLLATGYALLKTIPIIGKTVVVNEKTISDLEKLSKDMIGNAIKIESDARLQLIELHKNKPEQI